ncbi:hypothetical protein NCS52_00288800 [Fusarium sp. LHS14.1]|nr:hypothetical protein NCS52_00288800 [Fusarium sp. LHS14.1]
MKRSLSESRRSAWQQPASCEFCRSKKIRCDKKRPCSNCTTRQLECRYVSEDANPITELEREDYSAGYLSLRRNTPSRTRSEAIDLARAKLRWANCREFYGSQQLDRRSAPPWRYTFLPLKHSWKLPSSPPALSMCAISTHIKCIASSRMLKSCILLIASVPGPQEGIYSFHTKHMCVRYPANLDDEDIRPDGLYSEGLPADQLTQMSYFLQRLKFAELCRDVMDGLPSGEASLPYDQVLRMSSRYTDFMDRLPWFFCADEKSTAQTAVLASRRPYLLPQKSVLLYGIYSRIGRLHRPFLLRGTDEKESLSVSHSLAIQCAERIIEIRRMVEPGDLCLHVHSHSMDQHSFSALLLLSMGILGEKDTELVQKRKANLLPICSMLKAKQGSLSRVGHGISAAIDRLVEILERPNLAHDWPGAHLDGPSIQDVATLWEELIKELPSPSDIPWDDFLDWQGP